MEPGRRAELVEQVTHPALHRARVGAELPRDRPVGEPGSQQREKRRVGRGRPSIQDRQLAVAVNRHGTVPHVLEQRDERGAPTTAMAGDPSNPRRLWLGGPDGLWMSAQRGGKAVQLQQHPVTAIAALSSNRIVAGGYGLGVSSDGGATFRPARLPDLDLSVSALVVSPASPYTLYVATGA